MNDNPQEQSAQAWWQPQGAAGPLGLVWRGACMGLAEVVPGVSGATIALITGIYRDLVGVLAGFGPKSLIMLAKPLDFARRHNLGFVLFLGVGMGAGVVIFARLMGYLLDHFQPAVWGFFSGVILMSVYVIGRARPRRDLLLWGSLGLVAGVSLLWLPTAGGEVGLIGIFVGGAIAICAWILPAVSGSYMLLAMGLYQVVIAAINSLDWIVLATLAGGMISGLMLFVRVLQWALARYYEPILALLTGFMLGSLVNLWPWQNADSQGADRMLSPDSYALFMQAEPMQLLVFLALLAGMGCIWCLARFSATSL